MTKEQKLEACSMRFDGLSIQEIADHLGVTKEYIRKITPNIKGRSVSLAKLDTYIYPNISRWMVGNCVSTNKLSKMIGVTHVTVSNNLLGKTDLPKKTIDKILEVTGMTYEEAFYIPGENSDQPLREEIT